MAPTKLARFASLVATNLGIDQAVFVRYQPLPLSGDNGAFDPKEN